VPEDAFASYLLARSDQASIDGLRVSDLYLACACSRGDPTAIGAFDREFLAPLERIIARTWSSADVGAATVQSLRIRLLLSEEGRRPRIEEFRGRGSLSGWLRVAAMRTAVDLQRPGPAASALASASPTESLSVEEENLRSHFKEAFDQSFREAFRSLPADDRVLLRLHLVEGLNLEKLAAALKFSRATAGRRIQDARSRLRQETLRVLEGRLDAPRDEVQRAMDAMRSRLEISLRALITSV
jgi:RNA polymerase sigma-70 factor (ECF subfamily)